LTRGHGGRWIFADSIRADRRDPVVASPNAPEAARHTSTEEAAVPTYKLSVNGTPRSVDADPDTPLLYVLRDSLGLNGPKFGCGLAQCGACTVHVDGEETRSCALAIADLRGEVTTVEGLGSTRKLHPLQKAFIDEQAVQCGYCINGMIMTSAALLRRNKNPSEAEIRDALLGNLCRCGTHQRIIAAVQRAAKSMG
jgi:nicotinate dehydrogenase subunit A